MPRFGINLRRKSSPDEAGSAGSPCSGNPRSNSGDKNCTSEGRLRRHSSSLEKDKVSVLAREKRQVPTSTMNTTSTSGEISTGGCSREQPETDRNRRNAICNEIERHWFLQGAYLEKHRHNLQVTHELTARGLMWS